jgi:hypothetical protein
VWERKKGTLPSVLLEVAVGESGSSAHMMASADSLYSWRSRFSAIDTTFAPKKFILDRRTCSEIAKILA